MQTKNKILELTFNFSLEIIELYKKLLQHNEYVISKQLLRSAISIGANVEETAVAQTKKDCITKMSIASKEAMETRYWLRLLLKSKLVSLDYNPHLDSIEHIINILTKNVKHPNNPFIIQHLSFNIYHLSLNIDELNNHKI